MFMKSSLTSDSDSTCSMYARKVVWAVATSEYLCVWVNVSVFYKNNNILFITFLLYFFISSVRNAAVVIAASLIAFSWETYGNHVFTITGKTTRGLPPFRPPPTSDTTANGTVVSFGEIVKVRRKQPVTRWRHWIFLINDWAESFTSRIPLLSERAADCLVFLSVCFKGLWRRASGDPLHGPVGEHCYCESIW